MFSGILRLDVSGLDGSVKSIGTFVLSVQELCERQVVCMFMVFVCV